MESTVDHLDRERRRMLAGFLEGFVAWQLAQIVQDLFDGQIAGYLIPVLHAAALIGMGIFGWYGYRIIRLCKQLEGDPALDEALNDERIRALRQESLAFSFWVLVIYIGGMRLLDLTGLVKASGPYWQLGLVVGAASAIGYFLWKEWRDAD